MSNTDLNIHRVIPEAHVRGHSNCDVLHLHIRTKEYDASSWEEEEALRVSLFFEDGKLKEGITNLISELGDELVRLYKLEAEESE